MSTTTQIELETLPKLAKDVRLMAASLGTQQARGLVDLYYGLQDFRIQAKNQNRQLSEADEPHETVSFFFDQFHRLERDIQKALDTYSASQPLGEWSRQHVGVGPVIAAGLLAHIPIETTPRPSSLWRFAGMEPGQRAVKGQKRNWNASLKLLCWKLGDSFVKQSGKDECYYGKLYLRRKEYELARNERGGNRDTATQRLATANIVDEKLRKTLQSGKLPEGQLLMRARRYAVKRFLLHYWEAAWWLHYGTQPPEAYVFSHLEYDKHTHCEPCPISMPKPRSA